MPFDSSQIVLDPPPSPTPEVPRPAARPFNSADVVLDPAPSPRFDSSQIVLDQPTPHAAAPAFDSSQVVVDPAPAPTPVSPRAPVDPAAAANLYNTIRDHVKLAGGYEPTHGEILHRMQPVLDAWGVTPTPVQPPPYDPKTGLPPDVTQAGYAVSGSIENAKNIAGTVGHGLEKGYLGLWKLAYDHPKLAPGGLAWSTPAAERPAIAAGFGAEAARAGEAERASAERIDNPVGAAVAPNIAPTATMMIPGVGPELAAAQVAGGTYAETNSLPRAAAAGLFAEAGGRAPVGQIAEAAAPAVAKGVGEAAAPIVSRVATAAGVGGTVATGEEVSEKVLTGKPIDWHRVLGGAATYAGFDAGMQVLHLAYGGGEIPKSRIEELRQQTLSAAQQDFAAYQQAHEQSRRAADDAAPAEVGHIVEQQEVSNAHGGHPAEARDVAGGQREPGADLVPGRGVDEPRDVRPVAPPVGDVVARGQPGGEAGPQPGDVGAGRQAEGVADAPGDAAAGDRGGGVGQRPVEELGADGGKPATLDDLAQKHDELKPVVTENSSRIQLSRVVVPEGQRGQGRGTAFMDDLAAYADRVGKRITLTPSTDFGGSSVSRLRNFYKRFGFVDNKGRGRDLAVSDTMIREPRAAASPKEPQPQPVNPVAEAPGRPQDEDPQKLRGDTGRPAVHERASVPEPAAAATSRAEAERRLLEHYDAYHSGDDETQAVRDESAEDDTGGAATTFRRDPNTKSGFPREIEDRFTPEEIRQLKKRRILKLAAPNDQSVHPEAIGGPDALSEHGMGADQYVDMVRRRLEGTGAARLERAKAFARSDGDPETKYLAAYHDTLLPKGEQPEQVSVDPKELAPGTEATVNKLPVRVVDEGGEKVLKDGGDLPDTPVAALGGKIAIDRGSVKRPGEGKSLLDRLAGAGDDAMKRIMRRNSGATPKTGLDPRDLADFTIVGAGLIARGVRGVKRFTAELVELAGEHVRPHAAAIYRAAREHFTKARTDEDAYERAAAATVKGATIPQAEGTQQTVRRLTGQAKPEQVRRELANLAASMSKAQAASKAGYKAGVDETTGLKKELARIVKENLPTEERGKFLSDVAKANNLTQLRHALTKVERVVREVDWREARDSLKKTVAKLDVDKLSPALKNKAADLISPLSLKQLDAAGEARLKSLVEFAERDKDGVIPPQLVDAAKAALEKKRPEDMTAQEMRGLATVLKNVMAQDRLLRELRVGKRYRQVRDAQDEAVVSLKSKPAAGEGGIASRAMFGRTPTDEAGNPMADPKKHWVGTFIERRLNPDALAMEFDNGQEHGIFGNLLRHGLRDGADQAYRLFYAGQDHLAAATEGIGLKWGSPKLTEWANERVPFEMERPTARVVRDVEGRKLGIAGDGSTPARDMTPAERATLARAAWNPGKGGARTITMTRAQRLHLAAMLTDPETRPLLSRVKFKDQRYSWGFEMNDADKTRFLASLTPEERHVMDAMKGWLGGRFMEAQNEVFRRIDGFDRLTNPDYFPRRADRTEIAPDEPPTSATQYGKKYLEEMGQYQDRVNHSLPFLIDNAFEVFRDVTFKGSAFTGQAEHLHAAWSVLGSPRVRNELVRVYGTQVLKQVDEFMKAATMMRGDEGGHFDKAVSSLSANAAKAVLWKPRIAAKQLTGVIALMGDLGPGPVSKAVRKIARDPKLLSSTWAELKEHSGILRDRYEGAANRMISAQYDDRRSALGRASLLEKIKEDPSQLYKPHKLAGLGVEHALDLMQAMDYVTAVVAYHAARETGLEPAAAAQRASLAISRTQNASSPVEYSGMQNEGRHSSLYRVMSMFSSQNEATYNLLARKVIEYKYGPKDAKATAKMARDIGLIAGASLVGAAAIDAAFSGPDDKRKESEKVKARRESAEAKRSIIKGASDVAGLTAGPTAGQALRAAGAIFTRGDAGAVNLLPAPVRAFADTAAGAGQVGSGLNGDGIRRGGERSDGQKVMDGAEKIARGLGILLGLPGLPEGVKAARYGAEKAGVVEEER